MQCSISANKKDTNRCPFLLAKIRQKDLSSSDGGAGSKQKTIEYRFLRSETAQSKEYGELSVSEASRRRQTTAIGGGMKKGKAFRFYLSISAKKNDRFRPVAFLYLFDRITACEYGFYFYISVKDGKIGIHIGGYSSFSRKSHYFRGGSRYHFYGVPNGDIRFFD